MPEHTRIEPLHIEGLADYHCHPDYSIDATGSVDDYCRAALQRGLAELCFTTHFDGNPNSDGNAAFIRVKGKKEPITVDNLAPYVEDVRRAHDTYYPQGLMVKLGLEFGWYPHCEEVVRNLKAAYPFDYLLVGVHEIDDICFCCHTTYEECFARYRLEEMVRRYFEQVIDASRTGLFDTVAHLDYYKKYAEDYYGPAVHEAHRPFLPEAFAALTSSGTSIEVNTAGRRKGLTSYYPSMEILNAARRAGVNVAYLGSDAHRPEHVGYDFEMAANLVPFSVEGCDD